MIRLLDTRHRIRRVVILSVVALGAVLLASLWIPLPASLFETRSLQSLAVTDRYGILLREYLSDADGRGQWRHLDAISLPMQQATVAIEDRRFRSHPGVDPIAVARATWENVSSGRVRSGGSTITQQVIRNVRHRPRTVLTKIVESWEALRLERMMSKGEILEQYLNRAPYGNQLFGVEAASRTYFCKQAKDLTPAEAAFLAAIPNAPTTLNPYRDRGEVLRRQKSVLERMKNQGMLGEDAYQRAVSQPIIIQPRGSAFRAPHAVDCAAAEANRIEGATVVSSTIDESMQMDVEGIVRTELARFRSRNVTNAAVVVMELATGKIRALVGSADYFDDAHQGQVNGVLAPRQPGSAIKAFTYLVALERGATAAQVIPDIPLYIPDDRGDYTPENFDRQYHGPVRLRTALACSYNIPAVRMLQAIGRDELRNRLIACGFTTIIQPAEYYGYGLTLGNAEVTLLELTNGYAAIARGGTWMPALLVDSVRCADGTVRSEPAIPPAPRRIADERAAFLIGDILSDPNARRPAFGNAFRFPFPCAVKTGTTKDYRDNWAVGFTSLYVVGVWAGNFDGSPMHGVSGVAGAGPIFTDVMMSLHARRLKDGVPFMKIPAGMERRTVCAVSGLRPGARCPKTVTDWFVKGRFSKKECPVHQLFRYVDSRGVTVERVFEVLPPEYAEWAAVEGIPAPPPNATRIDRRTQPPRAKIAILSPRNGDIFHLDPTLRGEFQSIRIVPSLGESFQKAELHVDSSEVRTIDESGAWWNLRRGVHHFSLKARAGSMLLRSDDVTITVE